MATSIEPLDVTLTLDLGASPGRFRVTWYVAGEPPVREKEEAELSAEFQLELRGFVEAARQRQGFASTGMLLQRCRDLGGRLLRQVLPGQMRVCYETAFRAARPTHRGLRLRLQLPPELEELPWEILHDTAHNLFLAANLFTSLVRTTPSPLFRPRPAELPLKCLVVASQPLDAPPLSITAEVDALRGALADLLDLRMWELRLLQGPDTYQQLLRRRDRHEFHVIHFIGHGVVDPAGQHSCLVFEDARGAAQRIDANALVPVLSGYTNLTLLVLNSCCGGQSLVARPYSSVAHELARLELGAIVAMQREVADDSALICARELYRSVASGEPVDRALNAARLSLKETVRTELVCDWFNPQLYLCASQSQLFLPSTQCWPWERIALEHIERNELAESLKLWRRAGQVLGTQSPVRERLLGVAKSLGLAAEQRRDWASLEQLADACQELGLDPEMAESWGEIAANRKQWIESIRAPLTRQLRQTDPVELGLAVDRCERLLEGIVHDWPDAARECYSGRADLRQRFWASDVEELRQLLATMRVVPVRGHAVKVLRVIDRLLQEDGHSVRAGGELGESFVSDSSLTTAVWRVLGHHPLHSPPQLREVRTWIAEHPDCVTRDPELDSLTVPAKETWVEKLGPDCGLVLWLLGRRSEAFACWKADVREFRQRRRQVEGHHHLALAHLSRSLAGGNESNAERFKSIHSWAVLLDDHCSEVAEYWQSRHRSLGSAAMPGGGAWPGEHSASRSLEPLREAILRAVRPGNAGEDAADAAAAEQRRRASPRATELSDSPVLRAIKVVKIESFAPTGPEPTGSLEVAAPEEHTFRMDEWSLELDCERAAARLVSQIADQVHYAAVPWGGYGTVFRFHWQDALRVFAKSVSMKQPTVGLRSTASSPWAESDASISEGRVAFEPDLRCAFSTLRYAWWLEQQGASPGDVLACLGNAIPPFLDSATSQLFAGLRLASEIPRGQTQMPDESGVASANPLHDPSTFTSDWKTLLLRALLRDARARLAKDGVQLETLEATVEIVESLRQMEAGRSWIEAFQQHVVEEVRKSWRRTSPDRAVNGLPQLQLLTRLGMPGALREALAEGLLMMAHQLAEGGQLEQCTAMLAQALAWNPECREARELLALGLLSEARKLHGMGETEPLAAVLKELRQVLADARPLDDALERIAGDADALESLVGEAPLFGDALPLAEEKACGMLPADLWRQRLQLARQRQAEGRLAIALDELCDAVLLLPGDEGRELCIEAFAALASKAPDMLFEWEVLRKGREFFPDSPLLEDLWGEMHRRLRDGGQGS